MNLETVQGLNDYFSPDRGEAEMTQVGYFSITLP